MPGYVSYTTGLVGADLGEAQARPACSPGTLLFVLGFTAVFVSFGALFGGLGGWLIEHTVTIQRVLGVITILWAWRSWARCPGRPASGASTGRRPWA